jgi:hypothetical protein
MWAHRISKVFKVGAFNELHDALSNLSAASKESAAFSVATQMPPGNLYLKLGEHLMTAPTLQFTSRNGNDTHSHTYQFVRRMNGSGLEDVPPSS